MNLAGRLAMAMLRGWSHIAPTGRGGYRLARLGRRFVTRSRWSSEFTLPDGTKLGLDLATYPDVCMACGLYELDTYRLIRRLLKPGMHFVDGGANIGYFTITAAKRVGENGRVDAFEPDPANRARLEKHIANNGMGSIVRVHPTAVAECAGSATLYHPADSDLNHGQASLYAPPAAPKAEAFEVPLARMDEAVESVPNLVKLDIEGAELKAIAGMERWLSAKNPPMLIVEHNPETSAIAGWCCGDVLRALQKAEPRYVGRWIGGRFKRLIDPGQIDAIGRQGNILYVVETRKRFGLTLTFGR